MKIKNKIFKNKLFNVCYLFTLSKLDNSLTEFYQWFVGFSDAESSFSIHSILHSDGKRISRFSFIFCIELHKDDLGVLEFIKNKRE